MDTWIFLLILISAAFLFSFAGVIFLLIKTKRLDESIKYLRRRIERGQDTGSDNKT